MYLGLHYDVPPRDPVSLTVTSASIKFRWEITCNAREKQGRQFPCEQVVIQHGMAVCVLKSSASGQTFSHVGRSYDHNPGKSCLQLTHGF